MQTQPRHRYYVRSLVEGAIVFSVATVGFLFSAHYHLDAKMHEWFGGEHGAEAGHGLAGEHALEHASEHAHELQTDASFSFLPELGPDSILTGILFLALAFLAITVLQLFHLRQSVKNHEMAEMRANTMAMHDALTGMPNRRHFEMASRPLVENAEAAPRAVVLIDLDNFKPVNDLYGHAAGDRLLVECAARLQKLMSGSALAARFGGDEFVILSGSLQNAEEAIHLGNQVIAELGKPFYVNNNEVNVGASIGIAMVSTNDTTVEEAIRKADVALYRSKVAGKNTISCFEEVMDEALKRRAFMERELKDALKNEQIVPYFQKVVDLTTMEVVGYEALARWVHPTMGVIQPSDFIKLAEETNLIGEVGYMVLSKSAVIARDWPTSVKLAVNLSPLQLRDPGCALKIISIIADAGLMPQRLEVEITENALIEELERAKDIFQQLRSVGVGIVMDDFGTGHSSLNHLRACQFDKIKIDRSFVARMKNETESETIVDAILGLSKGFGLVTTAEGIEDYDLIKQLADKGCASGQGFYFGRPMPTIEGEHALKHKIA